ncbi:MAG: PEGA domain-containing protein [Candidatus Omnitrophica bacterium]|nr:PEGA domain-containing protein [Candidatus Omnitrophota bacterium]
MQLARKILFYFFVLAYLVLCPLLIFYSLGYIYQPKKKDISQTGLIHLVSIPAGAQVYLDGRRFKDKTPATISELNPGSYRVKLRLKNRRPWVHEVTVKAGKSAAFKNILLLPHSFDKTTIGPKRVYTNLYSLKNSDYLIVQQGPRLKEFYVYDLAEKSLKTIIDKDSQYAELAVERLFSAAGSTYLIIYGGSLWDRQYLLIDFKEKKPGLKEISRLFSRHPDWLVWSEDLPEDIFSIYGVGLDRLDIKNLSLYPQYFENIKGFGLMDKQFYVLGKDNLIRKLSLDKQEEAILFEDEHLGRELFAKSGFYRIEPLNKDKLIFWGRRGDLVMTVPPYAIFDQGVLGMEYERFNSRLLFWTKHDIWLAEFNGQAQDDVLFRQRLRLNKIYEGGFNLSQCFWVYSASNLLLKDKTEIYLLGLTPDGRHHREHIVSAKQNTEVFYYEPEGCLYYLDKKGALVKLKLLAAD